MIRTADTQVLGKLLALVIASSLSALPSWGQTPHPVLREFSPDGGYQLLRNAEVVPASIYLSRKASALLVVSDALESPLLVWAGSQAVEQVEPDDLLANEDGFDLADSVRRGYLGKLTMQAGNELALPTGGGDWVLKPRPAVIGNVSLADLLAKAPEYVEPMNAYVPIAGGLEEARRQIEASPEPVRVVSFFGTWCGVCKQVLPNHLKVQQELTASLDPGQVTFELYGLDYPPQGFEQAEVKAAEVKGLPTVIVYRGDQEIGRYGGAQALLQPEAALAETLTRP